MSNRRSKSVFDQNTHTFYWAGLNLTDHHMVLILKVQNIESNQKFYMSMHNKKQTIATNFHIADICQKPFKCNS